MRQKGQRKGLRKFNALNLFAKEGGWERGRGRWKLKREGETPSEEMISCDV